MVYYTHVLAELVLGPTPSDGVFYFEFDCHALFADRLRVVGVLVVVFRADVRVWVEGLGIDFDEVGHAYDPILQDCGKK